MELLQLKYFKALAQWESVTRAAEELRISQPALSKTLANLERELGVPLFDRVGRRMRLNPKGEAFYRQVTRGLDHLENGVAEIRETGGEPVGEVRLLILAASNLMSDLFVHFHRRYPKIKLRLIQQHGHDLALAGECDFAVSATPGNYSGLDKALLLREELVLAVPADHPFAKRDCLDLAEAADCAFIAYSTGPSLRTLSDSLCHAAGFFPDIVFESDNTYSFKTMIQAGLGVALIPAITQRSMFSPAIVPVRVRRPDCSRDVYLSWRTNRYLSHAMELFKAFCIDFFAQVENLVL